MITFNRHDLVWLHIDSVKHAEYAGPLPMEPISALSLLHRWVLGGYPLIVARQDEVLPNCLRVGLAEPASWGKRRLSFIVNNQGIQKHQHGPGFGAVLPQLPQHWQAGAGALQQFLDEQKIDAHVYGSSAVQVLTGLPCLTESSDLDVLFKPVSWLEAEKLCLFLIALQTEYPEFKVDGEVLNPSGQAVQWRELHRSFSDPNSKLMVKTNHTVKLVALATYQQGFQCPIGSAA
ncbi:malonate decarboxylase holo-[acyl-carrier-protein] synthase [Limnobacter sp.]|uniref:malonate decarboxylase holo-[acyl-carrier-protein] synthase n=1 Tax=Limnobacter sp. TaxID=2003368 RepID=UPI0025C2073F|nr:malonate decarboxylase holo-[acyl-carrier-protein] synthase [Limnobacter sp.]